MSGPTTELFCRPLYTFVAIVMMFLHCHGFCHELETSKEKTIEKMREEYRTFSTYVIDERGRLCSGLMRMGQRLLGLSCHYKRL